MKTLVPSLLFQITEEVVADEESEDDDQDVTEETKMLRDKGPKVVISNEAPRKSAEKRKSGSKVCSKLSFVVLVSVHTTPTFP